MPRRSGSPHIEKAFEFLKQVETDGKVFTCQELMAACGWKENTARAMLSKKLGAVLQRVDGGYRCIGVASLTAESFARLCSQSAALASDPQRPRLPARVEGLVIKAREAALAAVQHYNNPTALFRSGNYIVLMTIAYTSLFHAIFERDGVDYVSYDNDGNPKTVGGEKMLWDVTKCASEYEGGKTTPMSKNLEVIVPLRHRIEHRFMPEIDPDIAGHCQSMLMNFERIIVKEFTNYYALNTSLALALQFSTERPPAVVDAMRRVHSAEYKEIKKYLADFHKNVPDEIMGDPAFAFRMWLIPKPVAEARAHDIAIEYVPMKDATPEQMEALEHSVVAIKMKEKMGDPSSRCDMWESEVIAALQKALGDTVPIGAVTRRITGHTVRMVVAAHAITSPSDMYYRPEKAGSRAMYGKPLVDWIVAEYKKDPDFFTKAKEKAEG